MTHKADVIPGFKVMEWLEKVREEDYRLQRENPEQFAKELEDAYRAYQTPADLNKRKQRELNENKQHKVDVIPMSK